MGASPQRGYNHNIAHRGRVYHVQSEDSGCAKSHIYTHIFVDGTIIATNKVDYDPKREDLATHVVSLMQASHKKMIQQLRRGELDQKIEVLLGGHPQESKDGPRPVQPATTAERPAAPGPVLAQRRVRTEPPIRRLKPGLAPNTPSPATAEATPGPSAPTVKHPGLRSPLASTPAAQEWLSAQHQASHPGLSKSSNGDRSSASGTIVAKSSSKSLDAVREQIMADTETPSTDFEQEIRALFADA